MTDLEKRLVALRDNGFILEERSTFSKAVDSVVDVPLNILETVNTSLETVNTGLRVVNQKLVEYGEEQKVAFPHQLRMAKIKADTEYEIAKQQYKEATGKDYQTEVIVDTSVEDIIDL